MACDEFGIIRRFFTRPIADPDVLIGIGDDAAVVAAAGALAIAVDTLVGGVHFPLDTPADAVGHRLLAVNLSDMAAMGARPRWCTLALTLNESDERWLEDFARGLFALAEQHRVALIGGDLTRGPLCASLQIIGQIDSPGGPLRRAGAHVGDDIYVTGSLGDSAAGLTLMQSGSAQVTGPQQALISRFLKPTPRVAEGLALAGLASAAIDVSDGLLADLGHVCAASGVAAHVDVEQVPLSAELMALFPPQTAEGYALAGGDDYELCFTAAPAHAAAIAAVFERLGTALHRIGWVQAGSGVDCYRDGEVFEPARRGYQHFVA